MRAYYQVPFLCPLKDNIKDHANNLVWNVANCLIIRNTLILNICVKTAFKSSFKKKHKQDYFIRISTRVLIARLFVFFAYWYLKYIVEF